MAHRPLVAALIYDGLGPFEFGLVVEAFALPRPELGIPWYRFRVCSIERRPVRALGGVTIETRAGLGVLKSAHTIVIPGWRDIHETPPAALLAALRRAHDRGARIVSICSGVFVLAAAGLLDGKRATTHWRYTDILRARYPSIQVEPDVLYVAEGRIFTSAGSAAGLDLCLHLVRLDYGADIANQVARRLVIAPHRDGGQAQFISRPVPAQPGHGLARATEWALAHLDRSIRIDDLAKAAMLSPRTFARRFQAEVGTTPHRWLIHQRVHAAQRQLEGSRLSIEEVANAVGFDTAQTLRL